MPRLKILFTSPECFPFAKVGGLGDVVGALPLALAARGHDVRVVLPRYRSTKKFESHLLSGALGVPFGPTTMWAGVRRAELKSARAGQPPVPVYLLEHDHYFDRGGVYNDEQGSFGDDLARFAFLSKGSIEVCRYLGFEPDVIHVNDWPTALVPVYLDTIDRYTPMGRAATVLTIHNMGYQGWFPRSDLRRTGLGWDSRALPSLDMHGRLNLLKAALVHATIVSTVSPRYAREIQTADGGEGLDHLVRMRGSDVVGILNGIDDAAWNPESDPFTAAPFSFRDLSGKAACKAALQRELGLPERSDVPLIGMVSRLVGQKGIDLVSEALGPLLGMDLQMVVLGSGESWAEAAFTSAAHGSDRFRAWIGVSEGLAHRIEAGCDLFLMPSRYEPCGLNQMYSQRYGTLPVVRAVGGLDDTVEHGVTGFKFEPASAGVLVDVVRHACDVYRWDHGRFHAMQVRSMQKQMGWGYAARQYEALYRLAMGRRRSSLA